MGMGEDPRRGTQENLKAAARGSAARKRSLRKQIIFLVVVALCTVLSYYATSVRLYRSSQTHKADKGRTRADQFFSAKELADLPNLEGFRPVLKSGKSAFTLPWDDWPPQQVHSLFFAHKELPRTEEFDREELGILHDLANEGFQVKIEELTAKKNESANERFRVKDGGFVEKEGGDQGKIEEGLRGAGIGTRAQQVEEKAQRAGNETSRSSGESEVEKGAGEAVGKTERHAKVNSTSTRPSLEQLEGTRNASEVRNSAESKAGALKESAVINTGSVQTDTDGTLLAERGDSREGRSSGEEEGAGGVDDERGTGERQLRTEQGHFETPPGLYDAISDEGYHQCVEREPGWAAPPLVERKGYLFPALDGGLSQQIFEIANAVVIARVLNVTLVVPEMRADAFWKDGSDFESIFDLDNFKSVLSEDVRVVTLKDLPENMRSPNNWIQVDRVQNGFPDDYLAALNNSFRTENVTFLYSMWAALNHVINAPYEKLRCRAKYQALRFSPTVVGISNSLQQRMREMAGGPFLAIHLRFEVDMVMHQAGCDYGIDDPKEEAFWIEERKMRGWPEARPNELMRKNGYCPPTPEEIGKWLQGLGFNRSTQVYLASGKMYHEDVFLPPFLDIFPNTFKKEDLLTEKEKALVKGKNNLLAAIDFGVLAEADVVALTFHGVMKLSIQGHRSWNGFHKTLLYPVWESWNFRNLAWEQYKKRVAETTPVGRPSLRTKEETVEVMGNPIPECMCQN